MKKERRYFCVAATINKSNVCCLNLIYFQTTWNARNVWSTFAIENVLPPAPYLPSLSSFFYSYLIQSNVAFAHFVCILFHAYTRRMYSAVFCQLVNFRISGVHLIDVEGSCRAHSKKRQFDFISVKIRLFWLTKSEASNIKISYLILYWSYIIRLKRNGVFRFLQHRYVKTYTCICHF